MLARTDWSTCGMISLRYASSCCLYDCALKKRSRTEASTIFLDALNVVDARLIEAEASSTRAFDIANVQGANGNVMTARTLHPLNPSMGEVTYSRPSFRSGMYSCFANASIVRFSSIFN